MRIGVLGFDQDARIELAGLLADPDLTRRPIEAQRLAHLDPSLQLLDPQFTSFYVKLRLFTQGKALADAFFLKVGNLGVCRGFARRMKGLNALSRSSIAWRVTRLDTSLCQGYAGGMLGGSPKYGVLIRRCFRPLHTVLLKVREPLLVAVAAA